MLSSTATGMLAIVPSTQVSAALVAFALLSVLFLAFSCRMIIGGNESAMNLRGDEGLFETFRERGANLSEHFACELPRTSAKPNFRESPIGEECRIPIPRTPVNKGIRRSRGYCTSTLLMLLLGAVLGHAPLRGAENYATSDTIRDGSKTQQRRRSWVGTQRRERGP